MKNYEKLTGAANRINRALQHKLSIQKRFGESKHEAKQAARETFLKVHGNLNGYNSSTKVNGIFSIKTMESYRQTAAEFAKWAAGAGLKNAGKITSDLAGRYLQERQLEGKSTWTVSKDMSALNKIFNYSLNKAELGLKNRSLVEITRSRNVTENDKRNFSKFADQIILAKATGCRRESVLQVKPQNFVRNAQGKIIAVNSRKRVQNAGCAGAERVQK